MERYLSERETIPNNEESLSSEKVNRLLDEGISYKNQRTEVEKDARVTASSLIDKTIEQIDLLSEKDSIKNHLLELLGEARYILD